MKRQYTKRILSTAGMIVAIMIVAACSNTSDLLQPLVTETEAATTVRKSIYVDMYDVPMALVPAGPFEMGSNNGADDERPAHTVFVNAFYIDIYEVTNSRYAACVDAGICDTTTDTTSYNSSYSRRHYFGNPEYDDYPVIYASWYEAQVYCRARGGRLPTEAEWEKAARGGLEGKAYPWGDEAPVCEIGSDNGAMFDDDGACNDTDTTIVGSYGPNGYGLYDVAGNVWEWVGDYYDEDYYANSPSENPTGPENGLYPVIRGGGWDSQADGLRVSDRRFNPPESGSLSSGFRCVIPLSRTP